MHIPLFKKANSLILFSKIVELNFIDEKISDKRPIKGLGSNYSWSSKTINEAIENGLERAGKLLDISVPEVRNRATINGAIEIGRAPGVIQVTFLVPLTKLDAAGLGDIARQQYDIK